MSESRTSWVAQRRSMVIEASRESFVELIHLCLLC